jgi:nitroreductase
MKKLFLFRMKSAYYKILFLMFLMQLVITSVHFVKSDHTAEISLIREEDSFISLEIGVGDPDSPRWRQIFTEIFSSTVKINISEAGNFLPPSEENRWYIKVHSNEFGLIDKFNINDSGTIFHSECVPVPFYENKTSISFLPGVTLEMSIARRQSIRDFPSTNNYTEPRIDSKLLSKILWGSYGKNEADYTITNTSGRKSVNIYVANKTAIYRYLPQTNSLILHKSGDYRFSENKIKYPGVGSHKAPIELFISFDTNKNRENHFAFMQMGGIIQNMYLICNNYGLGTVTVSGIKSSLVHDILELPNQEIVLLNMPIGYPVEYADYNLSYIGISDKSNLLEVDMSHFLLEDILSTVNCSSEWVDEEINLQVLSNVVWSIYGSSFLKDRRVAIYPDGRIHKTIPSAHADYPLKIMVLNSSGSYWYHPSNHSLTLSYPLDRREAVLIEENIIWNTPPLMVILFWDHSKDTSKLVTYVEAGAALQNLRLMANANRLVCDWTKLYSYDDLNNILDIGLEENLEPMIMAGIGNRIEKNGLINDTIYSMNLIGDIPNIISYNDSVTFNFVIEYIGVDGYEKNIELIVDNIVIEGKTLILNNNDYIEVNFTVSNLTPGSHLIKIDKFEKNIFVSENSENDKDSSNYRIYLVIPLILIITYFIYRTRFYGTV